MLISFFCFSHISLVVHQLGNLKQPSRPPTKQPTDIPSFVPSYSPSSEPSNPPTPEASSSPSNSPRPSAYPTQMVRQTNSSKRHAWHYVYNVSSVHHTRLFFHLFCFIIKLYLALKNSIWIPEQGAKSQTNTNPRYLHWRGR